VGEVKYPDQELQEILELKKSIPRTALLGMLEARDAVANCEFEINKFRTGFISATTVGGMDRTEEFFSEFLTDPMAGTIEDVRFHECGKTTQLIAEDLGATDFISTINTACSSSVNSIIYGARLIAHGHLDVVIAGGADALCKFTLNGFNSLMILDKERCRPFDASRAGLNLGEGAGFVVLASEKVIQETKATVLGTISGFGISSDAFHQTASSPEGKGSFIAMEKALTMAVLKTTAIDYMNLHGTGTENNDLSEGTAVKRLFESGLPRMSSTKSFTGHTLGASGGIEAVFSILSLIKGIAYPNLGFENPIPEVGIFPQKVFESGLNIRHVMSNSFGFGGNCSSIIFSKN
jgi:3-oxoacyl-[acyl-carrier-protein] synthase-1